MKRHVATALGVIAVSGAMASSSGCVVRSELDKKTFNVRVGLTLGDGAPLPPEEQPLCLDLRGKNPDPACAAGREFLIDLEALDTTGKRDTSFDHYVRVTVRPGTVVSVTGDRANGRNVRLEGGVATGQKVHLIGAYGPTRIEVEDLGYDPVDVAGDKTPGCANGKDDDGDGLVDYPADPGCSFPNDDSEGTGTSAVGVSPIIWYAYPDVAAAQGYGASTSFEQESVVFETRAERGANMIVTRVSSQGFYVTDLAPDPMTGKASTKPKDWGSLYVFNFGLPGGIRVCDRVTYLSGTMSEFFGYTELGFPSFGIRPWDPRAPELGGDGPCPVPEPFAITASLLSAGNIDAPLEKVEAGLVRIATSHVAQKLGPKFPEKVDFPNNNPCERVSKAQTGPNTSRYVFTPDATNCDFDGSGGTDFDKDVDEAVCVCFCYLDWECSQFDSYRSRGNFRVVLGSSAAQTMQVNTGTVPGFEPTEHRGETLPWITGSLANFSGGNLNWTVETRCADDLVTCPPGDTECASCLPATQSNPNPPCLSKLPPPVSVGSACVKPRTVSDNESGSN